MSDRAVRQADRLMMDACMQIERLYPAAIAPVMRKHKATIDKLDKLEQAGQIARARTLIRTSGLLDDLAKALAVAGRKAAALIRTEMSGVREVEADGDDEEASGGAG